MYADIIVSISHEKLDRPFQYRIPQRLEGKIQAGTPVKIPFGKGNKQIGGYVIDVTPDSRYDPAKIKEIEQIDEKSANLETDLIRLAWWMHKNYGSTMIQALKTVLPAKKAVKMQEKKRIVRQVSPQELEQAFREAERKKQSAKARVLEQLAENESIPYEWVTGKLGVGQSTLKSLEKANLLKIEVCSNYRNPVKNYGMASPKIRLSCEQQAIVDAILADFDKGIFKTSLIHGITGSGKTEVYISLIEQMIQRGRQAIVLIPEISLTYQTLLRFYRRFGDRVSIMNSTLSAGEKYDQCERAKNGELDVIIGPRSALFTPFPRIGLILIDEEHESSYKSENIPRYHARETAMELAAMHHAVLVLGSATPSLESYYRAKKGEYRLFELKRRLTGGTLPQVHMVDLRQELKEGNRSVFSRKLAQLLTDRLSKGEQSMLFLNRRGYCGFISCRACGTVLKCPHCDVSLSEHTGGRLCCHYCGYTAVRPKVCPKCGSPYLSGMKAGTQQIEEKLRQLYPTARILRMDADTTRKKESYEKILAAFSGGEADILLGTQMIVKGHDFPNVTLVGILAADLSLFAADYRAGERTFQLLTQAAGRAGRGAKPGEVVIQTYQPEHYALRYAAAQDYEGFYREEILYRQMLGYPPVSHILAVQIFAPDEERGKRFAQNLAQFVKRTAAEDLMKKRNEAGRMEMMGPAPAAIGKVNDIFRFVLYIKCAFYDKLVAVKDSLEKELEACTEIPETVQFDFDPIHLL